VGLIPLGGFLVRTWDLTQTAGVGLPRLGHSRARSRLRDPTRAVLSFIPLSANPQYQSPYADIRPRTFVDAYGLDDEAERHELVALLGRRARSMYQFVADQVATSTGPSATLFHDGHDDAWRNDADYIDERLARWDAAMPS
jgi:hypothetical protein